MLVRYPPPRDFYNALIPLSNTTITLAGTPYIVFPGGHYAPSDPAVQRLIDEYGPRFDSHGECLTGSLLRYWFYWTGSAMGEQGRDGVSQRSDGRCRWVYEKVEEGTEGLPRSFWLLKVRSGDDEAWKEA